MLRGGDFRPLRIDFLHRNWMNKSNMKTCPLSPLIPMIPMPYNWSRICGQIDMHFGTSEGMERGWTANSLERRNNRNLSIFVIDSCVAKMNTNCYSGTTQNEFAQMQKPVSAGGASAYCGAELPTNAAFVCCGIRPRGFGKLLPERKQCIKRIF